MDSRASFSSRFAYDDRHIPNLSSRLRVLTSFPAPRPIAHESLNNVPFSQSNTSEQKSNEPISVSFRSPLIGLNDRLKLLYFNSDQSSLAPLFAPMGILALMARHVKLDLIAIADVDANVPPALESFSNVTLARPSHSASGGIHLFFRRTLSQHFIFRRKPEERLLIIESKDDNICFFVIYLSPSREARRANEAAVIAWGHRYASYSTQGYRVVIIGDLNAQYPFSTIRAPRRMNDRFINLLMRSTGQVPVPMTQRRPRRIGHHFTFCRRNSTERYKLSFIDWCIYNPGIAWSQGEPTFSIAYTVTPGCHLPIQITVPSRTHRENPRVYLPRVRLRWNASKFKMAALLFRDLCPGILNGLKTVTSLREATKTRAESLLNSLLYYWFCVGLATEAVKPTLVPAYAPLWQGRTFPLVYSAIQTLWRRKEAYIAAAGNASAARMHHLELRIDNAETNLAQAIHRQELVNLEEQARESEGLIADKKDAKAFFRAFSEKHEIATVIPSNSEILRPEISQQLHLAAEYLDTLYGTAYEMTREQRQTEERQLISPSHRPFDNPFTSDEVKAMLNRKNRSAAGIDGLNTGFFIELNRLAPAPLTLFYNFIFTHRIVPEKMQVELCRFISKGKPASLGLSGMRSICWASAPCSGFSTLIQRQISHAMESYLEDTTTGCRLGQGTSDCIAQLYQIKTWCFIKNKMLIIQALDEKKAYDSIAPRLACSRLAEALGYGNLVFAAKNIISDRTVVPTWNGYSTAPIQTRRGVPQGSGVSTVFPAVLLNKLNRDLRSTDLGVRLGALLWIILTYVDDILLTTSNEFDAVTLQRRVRDFLHSIGMSLNDSKQLIHVCARNATTSVNRAIAYLAENFREAKIQRPTLRYLGAFFRPYTLDWRVHYAIRMKGAVALAHAAKNRGIFVGVATPVAHRTLLLSFMRPTFTFSCEVAVICEEVFQHMRRVQRGVLASALSLPSTSHEDVLNAIFGVPPIDWWCQKMFFDWWSQGIAARITHAPEPYPKRGRQQLLHNDAHLALAECRFHHGQRPSQGSPLRYSYFAHAIAIAGQVNKGTPLAGAVERYVNSNNDNRDRRQGSLSRLLTQISRDRERQRSQQLLADVRSSSAPIKFWIEKQTRLL